MKTPEAPKTPAKQALPKRDPKTGRFEKAPAKPKPVKK
jgi:hypothetical protein